MLFTKFATWAALASLVCGVRIPTRDYENKHYFVVDIDSSVSLEPLSTFIETHKKDFDFEHPVHGLDDHYVFSIRKDNPVAEIMGDHNVGHSQTSKKMNKRDGFEQKYDLVLNSKGLRSIQWMEPRVIGKRLPVFYDRDTQAASGDSDKDSLAPKLGDPGFKPIDSSQLRLQDIMVELKIKDPIFEKQWHLVNTNFPGNDINVTGLWTEGITGTGVVAAIIDDGLDYESEDLKSNFNAEGSWDFNEDKNLPFPKLFDDWHGTRCAGEIGAVKNDVCGVGIAYTGQIAGIRILSGPITSDKEASAMMYGLDKNDIYLCLWGPTDDGKTLAAPDLTVKKAMVKAIQQGRQEKGSIYVFASGNGGRAHDSCNFDGYTNSIYSITVGAIDHKGLYPLYSEACSAVMVVTYSSGSNEHIHTTDIKKKCSSAHGGTSAAAPIAAGIFALVLEMNPNLTWRDLQYVCALLSTPVNENDGDYQDTALGRKYSHKYGYGKLDAYTVGHFAKTWKNVKPQSWYYSDFVEVQETINGDEEEDKIISNILTIKKEDLESVNLERVEHITVTVNIESTYRGKVGMKITSPFGVVSELASFRPLDDSKTGFKNWTFMSVAHWGESGIGDWKLEVYTNKPTKEHVLEFKNYQLRLFGESIDAKKVELYDITKDYAAERRDRQNGSPATTSQAPTTTDSSESLGTSQAPSSTGTGDATETSGTPIEDGNADISPAPSDESDDSTDGNGDGKTKHPTSDYTGQYFMALAVVGFIVVVLFMRFHRGASTRRRRRREEYEFDIIPGEDYTDSEDEGHDEDSLDLGRYNNHQRSSDEERDRLYDEINGNSLPDYEDNEMFKIGDEDDETHKNKDKPIEDGNPSQSQSQSESQSQAEFQSTHNLDDGEEIERRGREENGP